MLGLVFAKRDTALQMVYDLLARGIIVLPAGDGSVLEFVPPLIIEPEQIDWAVAQLNAALSVL
jgi:acetylornithine/succinyldiaminopimelate/putrescine aminotransferase